MQKILIAQFDSAGGPKQVKEIVEYRTHRDGRPIAEFEATSGERFIAYLDEIIIKHAVRVPVVSL
jgi:hypothetical protein